MIWNPQQIESAALELPLHERARLAERLLASLDQESTVQDAWTAEIQRRVEAFHSGALTTHPGDDVLTEARTRLEKQ